MKYEILKNQASAVQEKVFLRVEESGELRRVLYVDQLDTKKGVMNGIMMHEFEGDLLVRTLTAMDGVWRDGQWWIEDGRIYDVTPEGEVLMEQAYNALGLTARSYDRILRVARTIADLAGAKDIAPEHLAEAVQYRTYDVFSAGEGET